MYAAERTGDHALTIVVINKTGTALTSPLNFTAAAPSATAQVFRYSAAHPALIEHLDDQPIGAGGFAATYAANSITLFVVGGAKTPIDFEKSGKSNIAVFRPDSGVWYSLSNITPGSYTSTSWGLPTDKPVPADYDGNGKADIAVWRSGSGTWYIQSSKSPGTYRSVGWGQASDIPMSSLTTILSDLP